MLWLKRAGFALASFGFCGFPLACGDDESATPPVDMADAEASTTSTTSSNEGGAPHESTTSSEGMPSNTDGATPNQSTNDAGSTSLVDASGETMMMTTDGGTLVMLDGGDGAALPRFDPQVPPTNAADMAEWLAAGYYMDWVCEAEPNAKTDGASAIHVHGAKTRVCSNVLLAASVTPGTDGELPEGVSAVKEVYDGDDALIATVVSVKTNADSRGGDNWYWYGGPDAEGFGLAGCTGCHSAAGSDDDHPGAGDFVYFQTKDETQLPPVGETADVQAWLAAGYYLDWTCEDEANVKTDGAEAIHVHPKNRICVNERLANAEMMNGQWPAGIAAVKELYADADSGTMTGAVLYTKVKATSDGGNGFFWFAGEGATGLGVAGCTGCHGAAGSDQDHPGAGDYVYDRVVE